MIMTNIGGFYFFNVIKSNDMRLGPVWLKLKGAPEEVKKKIIGRR